MLFALHFTLKYIINFYLKNTRWLIPNKFCKLKGISLGQDEFMFDFEIKTVLLSYIYFGP